MIGQDVPARVHEGEVVRVWDHAGLQLRETEETLYLSVYEYRFDLAADPGFVAAVRVARAEEVLRLLVTDNVQLAREHRAFRSRNGYPDDGPVEQGVLSTTVERTAARVTLFWEGFELAVSLGNLAPPIFITGTHPRDRGVGVYGCVREASSGTAVLNGEPVRGSVFANEVYTPWLGRPLSSAALGLGETLIRLPNG